MEIFVKSQTSSHLGKHHTKNKVIMEAKKVNELKNQDINLMKTTDRLKIMKEMKY
jgi:hypothetical protein